MNVILFNNKLHQSNCWLIRTGDVAVLIDPGSPDPENIVEWLNRNHVRLLAVLLTHEHADHCAGVNPLRKYFDFPVVCSPACADGVTDSRQNFSFYIDGVEAFEIGQPVIRISDGEKFDLHQVLSGGNMDSGLQVVMGSGSVMHEMLFIETPGHSPGSSCICMDGNVFTGDTVMNREKTPLGFPHSNRRQYAESIHKLKKCLVPGMVIYPGHGSPFTYVSAEDFTI